MFICLLNSIVILIYVYFRTISILDGWVIKLSSLELNGGTELEFRVLTHLAINLWFYNNINLSCEDAFCKETKALIQLQFIRI